MAGTGNWGVVLVAGAVMALTGCFEAPPEALARLEAVKAQGQDFDERFDAIEERLLGGMALTNHWKELGRRHRQVQEVACENLAGHVQGMAKHFEKMEVKERKIRRGRLQARAPAATTASAVPTKGRKVQRAHD